MDMKRLADFLRDKRGAAGVLTGIALLVLLGAASLAVDMGRLYTVRNELQNMADAAALAGVNQLMVDQGGVAVRDSIGATNVVVSLAQTQSQLLGLPPVADGARNDITLTFGNWDFYKADPVQAWTPIGAYCAPDSNANALNVTITRATGLAFGPVVNLFAGIWGTSTSKVTASATAFLGYAESADVGTVSVPLALPDSLLLGMRPEKSGWFARLLAPKEALAATKTFTFQDLGSGSFYNNDNTKPLFDTQKAYLFIVNKNDPVPNTVVDNFKQHQTGSGSPVKAMARGAQLYPISEFQWGDNNKQIFDNIKKAFDRQKDSSTGRWRVMVPIYSTTKPVARLQTSWPWQLARLLWPGVGEAQACFTFWTQTYTGGNVPVYVSGFANVDITDVHYDTSCKNCSMPCQVTDPRSCRNVNYINVEMVTGQDTVSAPGTDSGGPNNANMKTGASPGGAVASIAKLVK